MEKKGSQKNKESVKVKKSAKDNPSKAATSAEMPFKAEEAVTPSAAKSSTQVKAAPSPEIQPVKTAEAKTSEEAAPAVTRGSNTVKSLKKEYIENGSKCKVTFTLPKEAANGASCVHLVGQFNGWSEKSTSMKKQKNGDFTATLDLSSGREYEFRYLIDEDKWENDWNADKYIWSELGVENSVVIV